MFGDLEGWVISTNLGLGISVRVKGLGFSIALRRLTCNPLGPIISLHSSYFLGVLLHLVLKRILHLYGLGLSRTGGPYFTLIFRVPIQKVH